MDATVKQQIAIVGFGIEGQSAYRYFSGPHTDITIFDEAQPANVPDGVEVVTGKRAFEQLHDYDTIVRSPSIRPDKLKTKGNVTSVTREFFHRCPAPIIGVTATKGKGTMATMVHDMLALAGKRVHLVGNIGAPALDIVDAIRPDDIVVYELSSFQLWDLQQSPHVAIVGMIEPEHLDVHSDLAEYTAAKATIAKYQTEKDCLIYFPKNEFSKKIAEQSQGTKIPYTEAPGAHVEHGWLMIDDKKILPTTEIGIVGQHNIENACAAITAVWQYTQDIKAIAMALKEFKGLDHRLKFIADIDKVSYYDDSIATTPGSAIAAIRSFRAPKIIILGGSDKGADFTKLAAEVTNSNIKKAIIIGLMRYKIEQALKKAGFNNVQLFDEKSTMKSIVEYAHSVAQPGDVVIMSPACASFDMFQNYKDRGKQFIAAVKSL